MFSKCSSLNNIVYIEYFIHKEGSMIDMMFQDCSLNLPTHESWNRIKFNIH